MGIIFTKYNLCVTQEQHSKNIISFLKKKNIPILFSNLTAKVLKYNVKDRVLKNIKNFKSSRILAFCGIGDFDSFKILINKLFFNTENINFIRYADHYHYENNFHLFLGDITFKFKQNKFNAWK